MTSRAIGAALLAAALLAAGRRRPTARTAEPGRDLRILQEQTQRLQNAAGHADRGAQGGQRPDRRADRPRARASPTRSVHRRHRAAICAWCARRSTRPTCGSPRCRRKSRRCARRSRRCRCRPRRPTRPPPAPTGRRRIRRRPPEPAPARRPAPPSAVIDAGPGTDGRVRPAVSTTRRRPTTPPAATIWRSRASPATCDRSRRASWPTTRSTTSARATSSAAGWPRRSRRSTA